MNAHRTLPLCIAVLAGVLIGLSGCESGTTEEAPPAGGGGHSGHGSHGGEIAELGAEVAHLEVLHDSKAGTMTIYVTGPDATTILVPDSAPVLKMVTDAGPKVLTTELQFGEEGVFTATDPLLEAESVGRIEITIAGVRYQPDIPGEHGH